MRIAIAVLFALAASAIASPPQAPKPPQAPPIIEETAAESGKRVVLNGLFYDRLPDGRLVYCLECNKGRVPKPGTTVSVEEHKALVNAGAVFVPNAAPAVAAPTFRSGLHFDPDHNCDRCGAGQTVIERWLPDGRHVHTCSRCGNSWFH